MIGSLGALYCIALVIAPDVIPGLIGRDGMAWTPINSPLYRFGDNYYYGAWVAETIRNGIPPYSPSAAEYAGRPILETLRWFPLTVAALPSILVSDYRVVYVIDYAFTAATLFGVPFLLAYRLLRSPWAGVSAGIVVLFYTGQWWTNLPVAPGFRAPETLFGWLSAVRSTFWHDSFAAFFNIFEYEALQGSFRYINNSISAPILLLYVYGCFALYDSQRPPAAAAVGIALVSPLLAFSYPSHTVIAYALLAGFAGAAFLRGRQRAAAILTGIGAVTLVVLLAGGYIGYARRIFAESALWNNIFQNETMTLLDRPMSAMLLLVLVNKYTITFAIALALSWRLPRLRDLVLLVGGTACGLACVGLFDMPQLWDRFLGRGIDHLWVTCLVLSAAAGCQLLWGSMRNRTSLQLSMRAAAAAVLFIVILIIPLRGFGEYALASSRNLTRFMPYGRWEALRWIDQNLPPGLPLAVLDWDDITFVPIYTHAKLVVGNVIIDGRSPTDELRRYVALWKVLGYDPVILQRRLAETARLALRRLSSSPSQLRNPPLADLETYASGQIAEAVVYWPYIKKLDEIPIADPANVTTPAFVNWAMSEYEAVNAQEAIRQLDFHYVVVSGAERELVPKFDVPVKLVFENATHRIYALLPP